MSIELLRDVFENRGFKLCIDEASKGVRGDKFLYYELRGKNGRIYPYSETKLAVQFYRGPGLSPTRFVKSKSYTILQDADDMLVTLIPLDDFDDISKRLKLKKKRNTSKRQISGLKRGKYPA